MRAVRTQRKVLESKLARAGFTAAREEAREMIRAAEGDPDIFNCWAARRLAGEPLEWLTGFTTFLGHRVIVDRGVYVPRPQTEELAQRAIQLLPESGLAVDLCSGSGAIAVALRRARPGARVVATDIDANAISCALKNDIEAYQGDLGDPVPTELVGQIDLVAAVVPYVPTGEMMFLPRDVLKYEPSQALDGGANGLQMLERAVTAGARLLHAGGSLLLELGAGQDEQLAPALQAAGFDLVERFYDDEGDLRGVHAKLR